MISDLHPEILVLVGMEMGVGLNAIGFILIVLGRGVNIPTKKYTSICKYTRKRKTRIVNYYKEYE